MRWHGPKHYRKGRLEVGRFWIAYGGWKPRRAYMIGNTRVLQIGPLAVFVHARSER